jgi:predicted ester cyclase
VASLKPSAYAPYTGPEDFIMSWTDRIWEPRGMGQIREHYRPDIAVHGAYGTIVGVEPVIRACLQKNAAYPHRSFTGEDVVWEERGDDAFVSSHRIINCGRQEGPWQYGPATFAYSTSRNMAVVLVRDAMVAEEWVVRDEWAVVEQSGHDVERVAGQIAVDPPTGLLGSRGASLLGGAPQDPLHAGASGARTPAPGGEDARMLALVDEVWNQHLGQRASDYLSRDVVVETTRHRTFARSSGYKDTLDQLFGPFPDAQVAVHDVAFNDDPFFGRRVALTWVLSGTYCGVPLYGPVTGCPVEVLGVSHFLLRGDLVHREWRMFDELALLSQIRRAGLPHG